jgi:hypothetical protein
MARFLRTKVIPALAPPLFRVPLVRRAAFRTVSQTAVNYRGSPLSVGAAGKVHGGDRLPWVRVNFAPLSSLDWQIHVYGNAGAALQALSQRRKIPLHVFAWQSSMQTAGLKRDAAYLVRPDGYVALASADGGDGAIAGYLTEKNIEPLM